MEKDREEKMTGKVRPKGWPCEAHLAKFVPCEEPAEFLCPACQRAFCKTCFNLQRLAGCPVYTGTDQCLCIWEEGKEEYPACGHDIRGHKGQEGTVGVP